MAFLTLAGGINHMKAVDFTTAFYFMVLNGEYTTISHMVSCLCCHALFFFFKNIVNISSALPGSDATADIITSQAFLKKSLCDSLLVLQSLLF